MFNLFHKPVHIFTVDRVITVKLSFFHRETQGKWDADITVIHLFTKAFALEFYLLLNIKFLSSTLGCRKEEEAGEGDCNCHSILQMRNPRQS